MDAEGHASHETELAEALAAVLEEIADDGHGRSARDTQAVRHAQSLLARWREGHAEAPASPADSPPEYRTWRTGP